MDNFNFNPEKSEEMYEEFVMGNDYDSDNYAEKVNKHSVLSREEEILLAKRIVRGDLEARNKLIVSNLKLVDYLAKTYKVKDADYEDFIQEGRIGLIKAVDKFDYTLGYKFSTYASYYIKERFSKYIRENGRTIRIPSNMIDKISRLNHAEADLEENLGRKPTEKEIAKKLGVTIYNVREICRIRQETVSLDMPVAEGSECTLKDVYEDKEAEKLEDTIMKNLYEEDVAKILKRLPEYEKKVLTLHYGLGSGEPMTLDAVAKECNLTREGIRMIEAKAGRKVIAQLGKDYLAA